jgi:PHP family Zn ribbon phosphoesterase
MTPNNIVNMALLKGLDIIAITDHNSAGNAIALIEAGKRAGIIVIPGMELCTIEDVHMLCLFPEPGKALDFGKIVYESLPNVKNREDIFGSQILMDSEDRETGHEQRLLSGACGLDIETALTQARSLSGIVVPSHINRRSYSMFNTLGAIPEEYGFHFVEYSKNCRPAEFIQEHPELSKYEFIQSSDAHFLSEIFEREISLEVKEKSIDALLSLLS